MHVKGQSDVPTSLEYAHGQWTLLVSKQQNYILYSFSFAMLAFIGFLFLLFWWRYKELVKVQHFYRMDMLF